MATDTTHHPFLDEVFHIRWSTLTPGHIERDIEAGLARAQARIDALASLPTEGGTLTFERVLTALEDATEDLERAWGYVSHLDSVRNSPALREAYNKMLPKVSAFFTSIPLNAGLWNVLQAYAATAEAKTLEGPRKRFLEETLADFRENGAGLDAPGKERLAAINAELSAHTQKFSENVLDATNAWELVIDDENKLAGLPQSARDAARQAAAEKGYGDDAHPRWRFTLHAPSLIPVLKYLEDARIRRQVWEASSQVGAAGPYDNTSLIWKIVNLRDEKAKLLGHNNFADFILQRRMAGTGRGALDFIEGLHSRVKPHFDREVRELEEFKAQHTGAAPEPLEPWETAYWAEKRRKALYDFDEEELRPYFSVGNVIEGMFLLVQRLFGIELAERPVLYIDPETREETRGGAGRPGDAPWGEPVEVWHPQVRFYDIFDKDGRHLGGFYADWHPREDKRAGAWMNNLRTGAPAPDGSLSPHLGLMCGNLTPPIGNQPALITHREAETIFHEFGHLLHHLLGEVPIRSLNGTNVVWDFVELPSQIMENWCWERESLDLFARHHETGEPIPEALLEKLKAARNYLSASATMRQLAFGKLDLELHVNLATRTGGDVDALLRERIAGYTARLKTEPPTIVRRFSHLFASPTGYAAGYYSYKWAEVLDADAFTRFRKEGLLSAEVGQDFRRKILARGNSAPAEELFREFMGREPDPEALLERAGLAG